MTRMIFLTLFLTVSISSISQAQSEIPRTPIENATLKCTNPHNKLMSVYLDMTPQNERIWLKEHYLDEGIEFQIVDLRRDNRGKNGFSALAQVGGLHGNHYLYTTVNYMTGDLFVHLNSPTWETAVTFKCEEL